MLASIAPASERTLDAAQYLGGVVQLLLIVGPIGWAAYRARRLLLPRWDGPPARVAEVVLGVVAIIWLAEILGTFDSFGGWQLTLASFLAAGLVAWVSARRAPLAGAAPPAPSAGTVAKVLAAVACAAVVAGWMVPTLGSLASGMDRTDTLWYHMPLASRFVQTGSLDAIFYFDPIFFATFYPANSEVLHAVPILAFDRDIVSPLLNLGWLGLGLTACWSIGRPYGVAPQALLGGAIALGAQALVEFQAGEALNDITGVAFVMAAAAILVNGYAAGGAGRGRADPAGAAGRSRVFGAGAGPGPDAAPAVTGRSIAPAALAIAGVAAGIAAGVKLSFVAPVLALTVGVVVLAPRGGRVRAGLAWIVPALAASAYWYVRNLAATGNPIPFIHSLGPIHLPAPERDFQLRPGFSVAHYWNDPGVWKDWFVPGLHESFGVLWPATLLAMAGGGAYALWRGREPLLRVLGAMVLFTALAYLATPLTAGGEEGKPIAFVWNVRYIAPAVGIGLAMLPCLPALRGNVQRRTYVTIGLTVLLAATIGSLVQWKQGHTKGAIAAFVVVLAGFAAVWWLRSRGVIGPAGRRRWKLALAGGAAVLAIAAGFAEQRHYLEHRYENTSPQLRLADALRWARDVRDSRIALGGIRAVFNQYPFYGTDLSNHVQWLGLKGDHGAWLRIPTCWQWRTEINRGHYDYVVTTYDPFNPGALTNTKEAVWTRRDPAATQIMRDGPVSVFAIDGHMDPAGCEGLPRLSSAELSGQSVNAKPLANQPPGTGPRQNNATRSDGRERRKVLRHVQRRAERQD